ncbi:MAG: DUF4436 family protein [Sulfurimicrobium sp.]|nr:DUF4436 family protein [Sulfurimicrobium sp.]
MKNQGSGSGVATKKRGDVWRQAMQKLASAMRILVLPLVIVLYVAVLFYNLNESDRRTLHLQQENPAADRVHVILEIVSVDVARAQVTARMQVRLMGKIAKDEFTPAVNLRFLVNAVQGQQRYEFQQGERVIPIEVVFALEGDPNLYPFDTHQATLAFLAAKPVPVVKRPPPAAPAPAPAKPKSFLERLTKGSEKETKEISAKPAAPDSLVGTSELASHTPVPVSFDLTASITGFKFDGEIAKSGPDEVTRIQLNLRRADNVIVTSLGIQLMMICLALSMLAMVLYGTIQGKESALAPLAISPALIFGLPALRDTQPGVPPLGAFSDYISYLWAEYLVAASTIIAIWTWISRHRSKSAEPVSDPTAAVETQNKSQGS